MTEAPKPLTDEEVGRLRDIFKNDAPDQGVPRLIATIDAKDQGLAVQRDLIEAEMNAAIAAEHRADAKDKELAAVTAERDNREGIIKELHRQAARNEALEEAAVECERVGNSYSVQCRDYNVEIANGCELSADAIRALKT